MQFLRRLRIAVHLRDRLDAGRNVGVTLTGSDRVERHPDRLQRGGTETVDRGSRHRGGKPGEERRAPPEVHPLLLLREAAADHDVDDLAAIELRDLLQHRVDRKRSEIVRPRLDERPLPGSSDRCPCGGDYDGVRQRRSLLSVRVR
jgi:hypothetical protein